MNLRLRAIATASTAILLGTAAAVGIAAPALADDVHTPNWDWDNVDDDALNIDDTESHFENFHGLDIFGWTNDSYDGFLDTFELTYLENDPVGVDFTPVSENFVNNGLSTIVAEASVVVADGVTIDVTSTLEVEGSFSRWTWEFDAEEVEWLADTSATVNGDLGSDTESTFEQEANLLISTDGEGYDPILGWTVDTEQEGSFTYTEGDERAGLFWDAGYLSLTIAQLELDPCSYETALTFMENYLLGGITFGETLDPVYLENCVSPATPTQLAAGVATNQQLLLTATPLFVDLYSVIPDFEDSEEFEAFALSGLPAGLTLGTTSDAENNAYLTLSGTAQSPGTYTVHVLGYFANEGEGDTVNEYPLLMSFTVTVALAATGSADVGPAAAGALALVVFGSLVLVGAARRRRNA